MATSELQDLVARELVEHVVGTRRWARYSLVPRLAADADVGKRHPTPTDRREQILEALGTSIASRAELAARAGLTDPTVRRWLTILRKEGLVETTENATSSRNTKYRRVVHGQLFS
ncbi:winged helix-turn-helix domain-containing protein [Actinoplanes sp. NPDC051343]|uniref:winged helix-turn-helix domain-containing protein n=1 Tax=Actinoplanes sp. NPDC051343 TaxID=3363906 RepID=UPI00379DF6EA